MKDFTFEEIQSALDALVFNNFTKDLNFISADYNYDGGIVVTVASLISLSSEVPNTINLLSEGENYAIKISYEVGEEIEELIGDSEIDPPYVIEDASVAKGGDRCINMKSPNYYGTTSFFASQIAVAASGRCEYNYKQKNIMVSNNHVIGRSDKAKKGEVIYTKANPKTALFDFLVKFSCNANVDMAVAKIEDLDRVAKWEVRELGKIGKVRRPSSKEAIRKFGARSGPTEGNVVGQSTIRVGSYYYRGVFKTSKGFACPGDSGSPVLGKNNDMVGISSWGSHSNCFEHGTYFFTLKNPGKLLNSEYPESQYEIIFEE